MEQLLLSLLLESTAFLSLASLIVLCARRASAAQRHLVWTSGLLGLLLLPIALTICNLLPAAVPPISLFVEDSITVHGADDLVTVYSLSRILVSLWVVVAFFLFLRLIRSTVAASLFAKRAMPLTDAAWEEMLAQCATEAGITSYIEIRHSPKAQTPFTFGVCRPVIIIPTDANNWDNNRRRAVLLHEMAHIARRDVLTQWLGSLACCLYWFQPLAWYAAACMRLEREHASDDVVLSCGILGSDYAGHLVALAMGMTPATTLSISAGPRLETRLASVLDAMRTRQQLTGTHLSAAFLITIALLAPTAVLRARTEMAANMHGVVYDTGSSAIPNASLQLTNQQLAKMQELKSSSSGAFDFRALKPGIYALHVNAPGFGESLLPNLEIRPGERREFSPSLQSAALPQSESRRLRIGGNLQSAKLVFKSMPKYPSEAKQDRIQGTVQLNAVIKRDGSLAELHVMNSPHSALTQSALAAVSQWRYSPTHLNGEPVEVETSISVNYTLAK